MSRTQVVNDQNESDISIAEIPSPINNQRVTRSNSKQKDLLNTNLAEATVGTPILIMNDCLEDSVDNESIPTDNEVSHTNIDNVQATCNADSVKHCMPFCRHHGLESKSMVCCCVCLKWHHYDCVNIQNKKDISTLWNCPLCRRVPKLFVRSLPEHSDLKIL